MLNDEHSRVRGGIKQSAVATGAITMLGCISGMRELLRSNDPVELSWARAVLEAEGVDVLVFDANIAAIEGSISAFQRRLMVRDDDADRAAAILAGARAALEAGNDP